MSISPIVLRDIGTTEGDNRTPLRKNSVTPPLVSTVSEDFKSGFRPPPFYFFTDFTDSPNMQLHTESSGSSGRYLVSGDELPTGFDASRVSSGVDGLLETHGEITDDPEKVFEPGQKSYVTYRRSNTDDTAWRGDSILSKRIPDLREVYVKARFRFGPGTWDTRGSTKLFRIKGNYPIPGVSNWGTVGGGFIWGFSHNSFGMRNKLSMVSRPGGWNAPDLPNMPMNRTGNMDYSLSYKGGAYDFNGDGTIDNDPQLADLVNGGVLQYGDGLIATVDHVFGSQWHEIEFFMKANSQPGVADGQLWQWLNGSLVFRNTTIPWQQANDEGPPLVFRSVQLGGNDTFASNPGEPRIVEWMSWDCLEISTQFPEGNQVGWNIIEP